MNASHKEFLEALSEEAEDRDYLQHLSDCVMRFSTFMGDMPHDAQIDAHNDLRRFISGLQKMRVALLQITEPAGDHETDDMFRELLDRLGNYQIAAFLVVQREIRQKSVDPDFLTWCREIRERHRREWRERVENANQTLGDYKDGKDIDAY